jgi:TPR repeat protein
MTYEEFNEALAEARRGNTEAMTAVALEYFQGTGTIADPKEGMSWLQKAAALGNAEAQEVLAQFFSGWLEAAEKGDADSQNAIGSAYLKGIGTETNYKLAIPWFKKASAHGSITTKLSAKAGLMFAELMLPAQNFRELFEGAQKGNASLQYGLGFAYLKGFGTDFNPNQALLWFEKAAAQGYADAQRMFTTVQGAISLGSDKVENYESVVPIKASKGLSGFAQKHQLLYPLIIAFLVSYIATAFNIGWLYSLAIFFNVSWIITLVVIIISTVMRLIWPRHAAVIWTVLLLLSLIPIIGLNVHYIKGRTRGNPVSIILQNPFEVLRIRIFGADNAKEIFIEQTFPLDLKSENGAAKIFEVQYNKDETVICLIRTTGSHRAVNISPPGEANSFYVKDAESEEIWPLKETRPQDYEDASGVDLVFDPFTSRFFDLVEGNDTSEGAWHFRNVAPGAE